MSASNVQQGQTRKEKREDLIKQLRADRIEFGVNSLNVPTLRIPENRFQVDWPVDSQRVSDLIYSVYYDENDEILPANEREFILSLIREECREGGRSFGETEAEQIERDVIVQAVICFVNQEDAFNDLTAVLLSRLHLIQKAGKIDNPEPIPVFTNIFSRRLRRLIPALRGYGIEVTVRHEESGSHCTLKRLGTFQKEPEPELTLPKAADDADRQSSGASSGATTKSGKDFRKADGTDGEIRFDETKDKEALKAREAQLAATAEKGGGQ